MSTENLSSVMDDDLSPEERAKGYTKDDAGLTNAFATEPETSIAQPGERPQDLFGFNAFAETFSGRLAMVGFDLLVITELVTGKGIVNLFG